MADHEILHAFLKALPRITRITRSFPLASLFLVIRQIRGQVFGFFVSELPGLSEAPSQEFPGSGVAENAFPLVIPVDPPARAKGDVGQQPRLRDSVAVPDVARGIEISRLDGVQELANVTSGIWNGRVRPRKVVDFLASRPDLVLLVVDD